MKQLRQGRTILGLPWLGPLPDPSVVHRLDPGVNAATVPAALLRSEVGELGVVIWALLRLHAGAEPIATSYRDLADGLGMSESTETSVQQRVGPAVGELVVSGWLRRYRTEGNNRVYQTRVLPGAAAPSAVLRTADLALLDNRVTPSHLVDFWRWQVECRDRGWTAEPKRVLAARWRMSSRTFERRTADLVSAGLISVVRRPGYTDLVWLRELQDCASCSEQRLALPARAGTGLGASPSQPGLGRDVAVGGRRTKLAERSHRGLKDTSGPSGSSGVHQHQRVPARYQPLHDFLSRSQLAGALVLSFAELDELVLDGLPLQSKCSREWWSNNTRRPHARSWLLTGRLVEADVIHGRVSFRVGARSIPTLEELRKQRAARRHHAHRRLEAACGEDQSNQRRGQWKPNLIYLLHLPVDRRFKVGITGAGTNRLRMLGSGRDAVTVEQVLVPNRHLAEVVEADVLEAVEPWHELGNMAHAAGGYTEMWSDHGPSIDLRAFVEAATDRYVRRIVAGSKPTNP
jgi:hypothetical protein